MNVDELQSVHHAALSRSRSSRAEKEKGRKERRVVRAVVLPAHHRSQETCQENGLVRAIAPPFRRQEQRLTLGRLRWRLIHLWSLANLWVLDSWGLDLGGFLAISNYLELSRRCRSG